MGNRERLPSSEVKSLAKMKVVLAILALALPLFAEPAEALCTSTQGDPCLSKAEVSRIFITFRIGQSSLRGDVRIGDKHPTGRFAHADRRFAPHKK